MPILIDHLERRLGPMAVSWSAPPQPGLPTFNVGCFTGGVIADTTGYATLGLSKVPLHHPQHERHFFLELFAAVHGDVDIHRESFLTAIELVWSRCLNSRDAILRGDLIELPADGVIASRFTHLYAALPVYYDDDFKSIVVESGDPVAIVWLVPLTTGEAELVAERGWVKFEQELVAHDPDLMAMDRKAIV